MSPRLLIVLACLWAWLPPAMAAIPAATPAPVLAAAAGGGASQPPLPLCAWLRIGPPQARASGWGSHCAQPALPPRPQAGQARVHPLLELWRRVPLHWRGPIAQAAWAWLPAGRGLALDLGTIQLRLGPRTTL
jgi:hypothetical protein